MRRWLILAIVLIVLGALTFVVAGRRQAMPDPGLAPFPTMDSAFSAPQMPDPQMPAPPISAGAVGAAPAPAGQKAPSPRGDCVSEEKAVVRRTVTQEQCAEICSTCSWESSEGKRD